jgi:hypothetical protein
MIARRSARALLALAVGVPLLAQCLLLLTQCSSRPAPAPASNTTPAPALTPVLSVKELLELIIDPTADWIFDAAVVDVTAKGVKTTVPTTDDDWLRVERGAMLLAEASNLLKMPRAMAPSGAAGSTPLKPGEPTPELSAAEIEAKVNANRDLWNKHADELRTVALASLTVARARNVDGLFQVGSDIDKACENCHLEFWYPGDKEAVLADQKNKVTYGK